MRLVYTWLFLYLLLQAFSTPAAESNVGPGLSLDSVIREVRESIQFGLNEWRRGNAEEKARNLSELRMSLLRLAGKKQALATLLESAANDYPRISSQQSAQVIGLLRDVHELTQETLSLVSNLDARLADVNIELPVRLESELPLKAVFARGLLGRRAFNRHELEVSARELRSYADIDKQLAAELNDAIQKLDHSKG